MENGLSNPSKRSLKISLRSPKQNLKKKPAYGYKFLNRNFDFDRFLILMQCDDHQLMDSLTYGSNFQHC